MLRFIFLSIVYCCSIILNTSMAASVDQQMPVLHMHLEVNGELFYPFGSDPQSTTCEPLIIGLIIREEFAGENLKSILLRCIATHFRINANYIRNLSCELVQHDGQPSLKDTPDLLTCRGDELISIIKDQNLLVRIESNPICKEIIELYLLALQAVSMRRQSSSEDAQSSLKESMLEFMWQKLASLPPSS